MDELGAISAEDMQSRQGLTMLVYAHPGEGKTLFGAGAAYTPLGGEVIYLDCELGRTTLIGLKKVSVLPIHQWEDIDTQYDKLVKKAKRLPKITLVIDTVTAVQALGLTHLQQDSKTPDLANINDYAKSNEQILKMMRKFIDLADTRIDPTTNKSYLGWNIIFLAHVAEDKDKVGFTERIRPYLTPKAAEAAMGMPDIVAYLTRVGSGENVKRILFMENYKQAKGKIRQPANRPRIPARMVVPNLVGTNGTIDLTVEPALSYLIRHWHGEIDLSQRDKYPHLYPLPSKDKGETTEEGAK